MTRLALAAACCVLALGTAARAQVTSVTGSATTQVQLNSLFTSMGYGPGLVSQGGGAAYYSSFATTPSTVSFESANASIRGGNPVSSTSTSSVDITIKNGGAASVNPVLMSQITGASLGVYLANTSGACGGSGLFVSDPYGGCPQTTGGQSFNSLSTAGLKNGEAVAGESFEFKVTAGGATVYDFTGTQTLTVGTGLQGNNFLEVNPLQMTLNGVSIDGGVLQGLAHLQPGAPGSADGYMWDDSDVSIALGSALAAGDTRNIVYSATVSTFSDLACTSSDPNVCLVAYAAFGDPIGKGGGTGTNVARLFGSEFGASPFGATSGAIQYVDDWGPQKFATPTFNLTSGILNFTAVPEPKTWMSMILGFGVIGASLRRRRTLSYT